MEDFEDLLYKDDKPNAVVIGLASSEFHYEKLNEAFRCLLDGAHLIAIHAGRYYKREDELALGPGCFIKSLKYSANRNAVGKPNSAFFKSALVGMKGILVNTGQYDVFDDIECAVTVGMKGILVNTGQYREGNENKINTKPAVSANLAEAVEEIIRRFIDTIIPTNLLWNSRLLQNVGFPEHVVEETGHCRMSSHQKLANSTSAPQGQRISRKS
ncbi:hypothetical protein QE152_g7176 [Popillia japonica]|uniref:Uncharacterized protein n=1 Tax=Popillia japonica TaxID=7064 RepID=A0AAW1MEW8_POPJA